MNTGMNNELLALVQMMSADEKKELVEQILGMMGSVEDESAEVRENEFSKLGKSVNGERPACPHCGCSSEDGNVIRKGRNRNGAQRYYFKSCGKMFVPTTGSAFANTRKSLSVWRKFIELTITGASIAVCAAECEIAHQTAFTWRHKVLNAFKVEQESITMTGYVEADEMFFNLNYKGNHIPGRVGESRTKREGVENRMPRESAKRASE